MGRCEIQPKMKNGVEVGEVKMAKKKDGVKVERIDQIRRRKMLAKRKKRRDLSPGMTHEHRIDV